MTEEEFDPTGGTLALNPLPPQQSGLAMGATQTFRQAGAVATAWLLVPPKVRAEAGVRSRPHDTQAKAPGIEGPERIAQGPRNDR